MAARVMSGKKSESQARPRSVSATTRSSSNERDEQEAAEHQAPTAVQPVEPEDAYLTGVSRSLQRRLLGLNVDGARGQAKPHPETSAGLHSTGTFTETTRAAKSAKKPRKA